MTKCKYGCGATARIAATREIGGSTLRLRVCPPCQRSFNTVEHEHEDGVCAPLGEDSDAEHDKGTM